MRYVCHVKDSFVSNGSFSPFSYFSFNFRRGGFSMLLPTAKKHSSNSIWPLTLVVTTTTTERPQPPTDRRLIPSVTYFCGCFSSKILVISYSSSWQVFQICCLSAVHCFHIPLRVRSVFVLFVVANGSGWEKWTTLYCSEKKTTTSTPRRTPATMTIMAVAVLMLVALTTELKLSGGYSLFSPLKYFNENSSKDLCDVLI